MFHSVAVLCGLGISKYSRENNPLKTEHFSIIVVNHSYRGRFVSLGYGNVTTTVYFSSKNNNI